MSWEQLYDIALPPTEIRRDWTIALLGKNIFFFQSGHTHILRLTNTIGNPTITPFQPAFITEALDNGSIQGIFEARGRLGCWDVAGSVYWSSVSDPADFTPSLTTGVNVVIPDAVRGRIAHILGISDGFMIYSVANIVKSTFQQGQTNPFRFDEFDPSIGIFSKDHVCRGRSGEHYVWSQGAIYRVNAGTIVGQHSMQVEHVETADFVKFHKGYPRLSYHTNRYLVLQVNERDYIEGESIVWRDRHPGNEYYYPAIGNLIELPEVPPMSIRLPPGEFIPEVPQPLDCTSPAPPDTPYFTEEGPRPLESTPFPLEDPDYWTLWGINFRRSYTPEIELATSGLGTYIELTTNQNFALVFENIRMQDFRVSDASRQILLESELSNVVYKDSGTVDYTLKRANRIPSLSWTPAPLMMEQFRLWIKETREWQTLAEEWPAQPARTLVGKLYRILTAPTQVSKVAVPTKTPVYHSSSWNQATGVLTNVVQRNGFIETWQTVLALEPYEVSVDTGTPPPYDTPTVVQNYVDAEASDRLNDLYTSVLRSEQTQGSHYIFRYFPTPNTFDFMQGCMVRTMFNGYPLPTHKMPGRTHIRCVGLSDNKTYATVGIYPHFTSWIQHDRHVNWVRQSVNLRTEGDFDYYQQQISYTYQWVPTEGSGFDSLNDAPYGHADLGAETPALDKNWAYRVFKFLKSAQPEDPRPYLREFYTLAIQRNPANPLAELRLIYEEHGFTTADTLNEPVDIRPMIEADDWDDGNVRFNGVPDEAGTIEEGIYYDTNCGEPLDEIVNPEPLPGIAIEIPSTPIPPGEFNLDDWRFQSPEIVSLQGNIGVGPYNPRYVRAFVLDTHIGKWGSCDVVHTVFADVAPVNATAHDPMTGETTSHFTYENYLSKLCCVLENGLVVFFDRTSYKSFLVLGNFGRLTRRMSRFLEARFEFAEVPDCYTLFEPSHKVNHKIIDPTGVRGAKPLTPIAIMLINHVSPKCDLTVVGGRFELVQLGVGFNPAGER